MTPSAWYCTMGEDELSASDISVDQRFTTSKLVGPPCVWCGGQRGGTANFHNPKNLQQMVAGHERRAGHVGRLIHDGLLPTKGQNRRDPTAPQPNLDEASPLPQHVDVRQDAAQDLRRAVRERVAQQS